jgi:ABC-type antimicrobial peptide transport system permease subunit
MPSSKKAKRRLAQPVHQHQHLPLVVLLQLLVVPLLRVVRVRRKLNLNLNQLKKKTVVWVAYSIKALNRLIHYNSFPVVVNRCLHQLTPLILTR